MVAEGTRTRSLISDGVNGSPAPSTTARAVAAVCGMSKASRMQRSTSWSSAVPVLASET